MNTESFLRYQRFREKDCGVSFFPVKLSVKDLLLLKYGLARFERDSSLGTRLIHLYLNTHFLSLSFSHTHTHSHTQKERDGDNVNLRRDPETASGPKKLCINDPHIFKNSFNSKKSTYSKFKKLHS